MGSFNMIVVEQQLLAKFQNLRVMKEGLWGISYYKTTIDEQNS